MDFRILGPLEVSDGGHAVAAGGVKQRSLLAILLQRPNAIVSTDHLLPELWGDAPPASADNSIHVYISRLRKELGPDRVITRPPGYALRVDPLELDLVKFERLRAEGRPREALALWRGRAWVLLLVPLTLLIDLAMARPREAPAYPRGRGRVRRRRPWVPSRRDRRHGD